MTRSQAKLKLGSQKSLSPSVTEVNGAALKTKPRISNLNLKRPHVSARYESTTSTPPQNLPPSAAPKARTRDLKQDPEVAPNETTAITGLKGDLRDGDGTDTSPQKIKRWEPNGWRETLDYIREMRKEKDAPVDSMGAEKIGDRDAAPEVVDGDG